MSSSLHRTGSLLTLPLEEDHEGGSRTASVPHTPPAHPTKNGSVSPGMKPNDSPARAEFEAGFSNTRVEVHNIPHRKSLSFGSHHRDIFAFMRRVPHLYMISHDDLEYLTKTMLKREYAAMDEILAVGQSVQHAYVVMSGSVEVYAASNDADDTTDFGRHERVGTVNTENLFCIDSIVFGEASEFLYRAGSDRTFLGLIPMMEFKHILNRNVAMRQSIGRRLADHMDIFICFKDFCRHIFSHESAKHEYLPLWQILDAYYHLNNSIHSKMLANEIDTGAWSYAIRRLPENLTTTFIFDLVRALPPFLAKRMTDLAKAKDKSRGQQDDAANGDVRFIATKERRRCSWQLGMEGKTLVLLRDSFTDLIDFITCLCIHIIESNKLRGRLQGMVSPPAIDILDDTLKRAEASSGQRALNNESIYDKTSKNVVSKNTVKDVLQKMPLTDTERQGLMKIWPNNCLQNLYYVIMHREEYLLRVDASSSRQFQTDPFHDWSLNLRNAVMKMMGLNRKGHLPEDLVIDIISSNTHCTQNILSSFARAHRKRILEYAHSKMTELAQLEWLVEEDLVYFCMGNYVKDAGLQQEYNDSLKTFGIEVMEDTAMTGLKVDIVPVHRIDLAQIDPLLASRTCKSLGPHHFILNMDFAFGAQADGIAKTLVETFGRHIRSFNVMGKAGGIANGIERGDIQLASHVLLSKSSVTTEDFLDELRSCGNEDITIGLLEKLNFPRSRLWNGPVLTIPGTMLQNTKLLKYYSNIWHCIGLEMEGSYFCRQIKESVKNGILPSNVRTRFAYYTSDLPLRSGEASLSSPMKPNEGVPPLYTIARAFMLRILEGADSSATTPTVALERASTEIFHSTGRKQAHFDIPPPQPSKHAVDQD